MTDQQLAAILLSVLQTEHGRVVLTNDPEQLKKRLYILRASARKRGDLSYDVLSFRTSPTRPGGELWITKSTEPESEPNEILAK